MTDDQIRALQTGQHTDPFGVLGMHEQAGRLAVHAVLPGALSVELLNRRDGSVVATMQRLGPTDVFGVELPPGHPRFVHQFRVHWAAGMVAAEPATSVIDDAYRFAPLLGDTDVWLLAEGTHLRPYECLGAHPMVCEGVPGVGFAVWAPNARRVSLVCGSNHWDGRRHPMRLRRECGVWEIFIPGLGEGELYKFELIAASGERLLKADPYAFRMEMRPDTASVVQALPPARPLPPERVQANRMDRALQIYEVHLGSWRKQDGWRWLSYRELADQLVPYARDMGFTHIELLPVSEHPFDGSWGYQPVGLFAPTSRFGTPDDFRHFVDAAHAAGLGVILDWVPAHFPTDAHGLAGFDGTHLYEYADPREGFHQDWNTLIYNFGRTEVRNYLIANALYWLERYGIDGLRVDAVASMLYRDYSRAHDQWVPNRHGGRENLEAIEFLRRLNHTVGVQRPGTLMLAEESTAFPGVSRPPSDDLQGGGLGFHYKWNMGWMHDTLKYASLDPVYRQHHQQQLTFGLMYAFTENFVLPLSHDEVVHGKGSLLGKMPGDEWQRFANLRALYGFMWTYPGKKLLFMGSEWGQPSEWNANGSLPWDLLQYPLHAGMQRLVRDLNRCASAHAPLHELDVEPAGFEWISHDDAAQSVVAYVRRARDGQALVVVCNFTPVPRQGYRIGLPHGGRWQELLNTDATVYGGSGQHNGVLQAESIASHGRADSAALTLPPLGCVVLQPAA